MFGRHRSRPQKLESHSLSPRRRPFLRIARARTTDDASDSEEDSHHECQKQQQQQYQVSEGRTLTTAAPVDIVAEQQQQEQQQSRRSRLDTEDTVRMSNWQDTIISLEVITKNCLLVLSG